MQVLFITFAEFKPTQFGASLRPQKMYQAFLDAGCEVKLLCGHQTRQNLSRRRAAVREISTWLDDHRPDICYIESPVDPILWGFDRRLIRRIHRMGIPMAYFYRDFYWKFPNLYPMRTDFVGRIKETGLAFLQRVTDRLLKRVDIIYLPSGGSAALFSYKDMRPLPPAGERQSVLSEGKDNTCIYVGGISGDYGGEMMLRAFRMLNEGEKRYPLLLICREAEWKDLRPEWENEPWLEVHHVSGAELIPCYRRASLALMPIQKNVYTDLSVNVKLFEYMSFGLPVVTTNVHEISRLVRENGIGFAAEGDDADTFASAIRSVLDDEEKLAAFRERSRSTLTESNLWVHRAQQVIKELEEKR